MVHVPFHPEIVQAPPFGVEGVFDFRYLFELHLKQDADLVACEGVSISREGSLELAAQVSDHVRVTYMWASGVLDDGSHAWPILLR